MKHIHEIISKHTKKLRATNKQLSTKLKKANRNLKRTKEEEATISTAFYKLDQLYGKLEIENEDLEIELKKIKKRNRIVEYMLFITLILSILFVISTL